MSESLLLFPGSFSFYTQLRVGYVCIFSLKNPSYPEYVCHASSGVISFDIHPQVWRSLLTLDA